jgi:hypothetical protein
MRKYPKTCTLDCPLAFETLTDLQLNAIAGERGYKMGHHCRKTVSARQDGSGCIMNRDPQIYGTGIDV